MVAFVIYFVLPNDAPAHPETTTPAASESHVLDPRAPTFRYMAWIANSVAFGLGATLNSHYPRLLQEFDWSPRIFGVFLGSIFFAQALTFVVLRREPHWWRFQRSRLYAAQALMILAVVALPFADIPRVLVSAVIFGVGLGICYYSSIFYSLHTRTARGRNAGLHESLIGLGSMVIPFVGGWVARETGLLVAPYMIAGVMVGIALLVQELVFQKGQAHK